MEHRYSPLLAALLSASSAIGQYWYQRADFPSDAEATYGFAIGDRMFAGGGISNLAPFAEYLDFNEYIRSTDTWVARTPCPGPVRYGVSGFGLNGKGYLVCGWSGSPATPLHDVWEYDPVADSWTQKNDFPGSARYSCISVATSTRGYLGLGHATYLSDWWEYDPGADTWTQMASLPAPGRQACTAFVIDNEVYVTVGARDVTTVTATFFQDLFRYTPGSDSWMPMAPFPADGRVGGYGFSYNDIGYVIGGLTGDAISHEILNDAWAYSPDLDQWYQLGLFPGVPMASGFTFSISGTCYIGTGCTAVSNSSWSATALTPAFWEYRPDGLNGVNEWAIGDDMQVITGTDGMLVQWPTTAHLQQMRLFDPGGRVLRTQTLQGGSGRAFCSTAGLSDGLYIVQLTGDAFAAQRKVMVSR